jgi:hypothetical protein
VMELKIQRRFKSLPPSNSTCGIQKVRQAAIGVAE